MKPYVFLVGEDADLPVFLIKDLPVVIYPFTVVDGKTSQPSPEVFVEKIATCFKTYEKVIVVTISSELSGTYNSAVQSLKQLSPQEQKRVIVLDSGMSTGGVGLSVLLTLWESTSDPEARFLNYLSNAKIAGTIEDPKHLEKGGRINKIQSLLVQNMIKTGIRPILCLKEKKIGFSKVSRPGSSKVSALVDVFSQEISLQNADRKIFVAITHADCLTDAQTLSQELQKKFSQCDIVYIHDLAKVLETHLGPGALLLSWVMPHN